jgi:hypothetical protein
LIPSARTLHHDLLTSTSMTATKESMHPGSDAMTGNIALDKPDIGQTGHYEGTPGRAP